MNALNIDANILLGQGGTTLNNLYGLTHINISENEQYYALCIYGSKTLNGTTKRGIWISSDSGQTFSNTYSTADNFASIQMSSSGQFMYCNCQNVGRIYYSNNYGQSWTSVNVGANISNIAVSKNGQYVYATDFGNGVIYRSSNYGQSYSSLVTIGSGTNIGSIIFNETINCLFLTSTANGNMYKYNLSTNVLTNARPNGSSTNCSGIAVSDDGKYIHTINYNVSANQAYSSSNFGSNWTSATITIQDGVSTSFANMVCSPNGQYVYTTNYGKYVYYSTDYGISYSAISWSSVFTGGGLSLTMTQAKNHLALFTSSTGYVITSYVQPKVKFAFSGTLNVNYVTNTYGNYTFYAFATNQSFTLSSIVSVVPIYVCVVGGGGGGGIGNSTLDSNCNGGMGGGMVYGIFNASNLTYNITIGQGGMGAISTANGYATTGATTGGNTTLTSTGLSITAYGGNSGTWNTSPGTGITKATNPSGNSGTSTGLKSNGALIGGASGLSQGSNGQGNALAGQIGNYCPLTPFNGSAFYLPFGSGGTGGANSVNCESASPFAGGGHSALSQSACGTTHSTYNNAVLVGLSASCSSVGGYWGGPNSANDAGNNYGRASSNSGAGGGSAQSQGYAGYGGSGIVIIAVQTNYLI